jgi:hypothetical protein
MILSQADRYTNATPYSLVPVRFIPGQFKKWQFLQQKIISGEKNNHFPTSTMQATFIYPCTGTHLVAA